MNTIIDHATSFQFTSMLALFVYWVPLGICLCVYVFRAVAAYRNDLKRCRDRYYQPELTVGAIFWHLVLAATPAVNLFAMVFDCASSIYEWLGKFLSIGLVRSQYRNESEAGAKD